MKPEVAKLSVHMALYELGNNFKHYKVNQRYTLLCKEAILNDFSTLCLFRDEINLGNFRTEVEKGV